MSNVTPKGESELILRGVAILAVVGVHFLAGLPASTYTTSSWQGIAVFLDQLSRISVPIFVAMSGYGLTLKYQKQVFKWPEFLRKRVFKLLPLYVLWSMIFYGVFLLIPAWRSPTTPSSFLMQLLLGRADYQMYFVPMIFQLYLLFPFLKKLVDQRPTVMLGLTFVFQLVLFALFGQNVETDNSTKYLLSDQQQYVVCFSWIFYFVLGMYLAKKQTWLQRKKSIAAMAFMIGVGTLLWATFAGIRQIDQGVDPIVALRFTRWPILIYASCALVFLLVYKRATTGLPSSIKQRLIFFGQHSYGIYLSHTLFLRVLFVALARL